MAVAGLFNTFITFRFFETKDFAALGAYIISLHKVRVPGVANLTTFGDEHSTYDSVQKRVWR